VELIKIRKIKMGDKKYLIWSNEHGAWWSLNRRGYTRTTAEAGRYNKEDALEICKDAAIATPEHSVKPEVMFLAPENIEEEEIFGFFKEA
jgi:hypothetical protein